MVYGRSYANVTLTSLDGDLSVVVYLPKGILNNDDNDVFYYSSRFDHGSMIGDITRKRRFVVPDPSCANQPNCGTIIEEREHKLYEADNWRQPHNSHWPESGVGLASEFGVGDDGAFCYYRCGWYQESDVTNGVLGYQEANIGEPFLKIGVGELLKGTCPNCDSTLDYRFNSPYLFSRQPDWNMTILKIGKNTKSNSPSIKSIRLDHEAILKTRAHGYALSKEIVLDERVLEVTTTLTNRGVAPFSTVWYSHNFFSCDHTAVGPGYSIDMNLQGSGHSVGPTQLGPPPLPPLYEEPGTWSWATPVKEYSKVTPYPNSVHLEMTRALDPGVRIKTEFAKDPNTDGGFTISACRSQIESSLRIPSQGDINNINADPNLKMYGYNLYMERGTFSPEPQILIDDLKPGQSVSWTQRLVIQDIVAENEYIPPPVAPTIAGWGLLRASGSFPSISSSFLNKQDQSAPLLFVGLVLTLCTLFLAMQSSWARYRRRRLYSPIAEED